MFRIINLKIPVNAEQNLKLMAAKKLGVRPENIIKTRIVKKALDARRAELSFVYSLDVWLAQDMHIEVTKLKDVSEREDKAPLYIPISRPKAPLRVIVVGTGPAGLFAAVTLARSGIAPLVLERGSAMDQRKKQVEQFWATGSLSETTNVQFGEGGAGTFSDGKLNTNINHPLCEAVINEFVRAQAPDEIAYIHKPHVGTDYIHRSVVHMRDEIIRLGGEFRYQAKMTNICCEAKKLVGIMIGEQFEPCDALILATGHSARDTYQMLYDSGVEMERKPFSVGVRIEHPQAMIDQNQYGKYAGHPQLRAADYRLVYHDASGRSAYSFCMCPGGFVVAAASEHGGMVTNGMSYYDRSAPNANAALLVGVEPDDLEGSHPLEGIHFQRRFEREAFLAAGSSYKAPIQLVEDFLNDRQGTALGEIIPTYQPGTEMVNLCGLLPQFVVQTLQNGLRYFDQRIRGFARADAVLTGVETRSSAPVRIVRGEDGQSTNIKGLYPVGEGAGYAGGIMSSAIDGIRCALHVLEHK